VTPPPPKVPTYDRIYAIVARIPSGRVATYGQVARLAGIPNGARQVGYALAALRPGHRVPWHRVVNAKGYISLRDPGGAEEQRFRLEKEGVRPGPGGTVDLRVYGWDGGKSGRESV
jgi:methylated-DNA-protein-cysteine methyltransferase-like protein